MHLQQRLCDLGRSSPSLCLIVSKTKPNQTNSGTSSPPIYPIRPISLSPGDKVYWVEALMDVGQGLPTER